MANINNHEIGFKLINCSSSATVHVRGVGVAKLMAMVVVIRRRVNIYNTSIPVAYRHTCR